MYLNLTQVIGDLNAIDFFVSRTEYTENRSKTRRIGKDILEWIKEQIGLDSWHQLMSNIPRHLNEENIINSLGLMGAAAKACMHPFGINEKLGLELCRIGALTHFIVGLYDKALDSGTSTSELLSEASLVTIQQGKKIDVHSLSSPAQSFVSLVQLYFRSVHSLPFVGYRKLLVQRLHFYINLMYHEQNKTIDKPTLLVLQRKSALPFVVMGFPALLSCSSARSQMSWQFMLFLYRLGYFVGLVDDMVDFDDDVKKGHPNMIHEWKQKGLSSKDLHQHIVRSAMNLRANKWLATDVVSVPVISCVIAWLNSDLVYQNVSG